MKKKYQSEALEALHETATGLHRLGLIDTKTMRDFDVSCPDKRGKALGKGNRSSQKKCRCQSSRICKISECDR